MVFFWEGGILIILGHGKRREEGGGDPILAFRFLTTLLIRWTWMKFIQLVTCTLGPIIGKKRAM